MQEISYGVVPLRLENGCWQTAIVQLHAGHWGFPKGHPNVGEIPVDCAARELREETGLFIARWLAMPPFSESYIFTHDHRTIYKTVIYYAAEVEGELQRDPEEIADARWIDLQEAEGLMNFEGAKRICRNVLTQVQ